VQTRFKIYRAANFQPDFLFYLPKSTNCRRKEVMTSWTSSVACCTLPI